MRLKNFAILLACCAALSGCGSTASSMDCPYTSLSWEDRVDDMTALEGANYETYDSIYHGMTYTYPKSYLDYGGVIKYMYDGDGKLCNVSWSYTGVSEDDVMEVYSAVCDAMSARYGGGTVDDGVGNLCEMWVLENETIMANAVITDDTKAMQIAFMNADVSQQNNQ